MEILVFKTSQSLLYLPLPIPKTRPLKPKMLVPITQYLQYFNIICIILQVIKLPSSKYKSLYKFSWNS